MKKILLGLTTLTGENWKNKIEEAKKFNIEEVALFPTMLDLEKRKELYTLLENSPIKSIPHVHLRHDMEEWELDYFVSKYGTHLFNIHPNLDSLRLLDFKKHTPNIYIENLYAISDDFLDILKRCGGICLDAAHWHSEGIMKGGQGYERFPALFSEYKIGCCHISGAKNTPVLKFDEVLKKEVAEYEYHKVDINDLSYFDYIKKYAQYLPEIISIELENSFEEQMKAREYLAKLVNL